MLASLSWAAAGACVWDERVRGRGVEGSVAATRCRFGAGIGASALVCDGAHLSSRRNGVMVQFMCP